MGNNIGNRIKTMRLSRGLNQADLANELRVSRSAIAMWEGGQREPDLDTIEALADIFNVPMSALVEKDDNTRGNAPIERKPKRASKVSLSPSAKHSLLKGKDGQNLEVIQDGLHTIIQVERPATSLRRTHALGATSLARNFLRNAGQKSAEDRKEPVHSPSVSSAALEIAVLFDKLDEYGKHAVRTVVNSELNRIQYFKNHHPEQENVPPHDQTTQKGSY